MKYTIEAARPGTHNYDSDYVGNHQGLSNIRTAKKLLRELCTDPEWGGWTFRLWREVDNHLNGELIEFAGNDQPELPEED